MAKGDIEKSTRHSKIAGDFGEAVLLYWLSRSGFECARVDHTGIDLIARRPDSTEVLGISVKSRTRLPGRESATLNVERSAITKASAACDAFHCTPYFGIVVDSGSRIFICLVQLEHLLRLYPGDTKVIGWQMTPTRVERYLADPKVDAVVLTVDNARWGRSRPTRG